MPQIMYLNLLYPMTLPNEITATIGYFDGVHLGHQHLISEMIKASKASGSKSCIITFTTSAKRYAQEGTLKSDQGDLTPCASKLTYLAKFQPDYIIVIQVDAQMILTPVSEFIQILQNNLKVTELYVGDDFKFGQGGVGTPADLAAKIQTYAIAPKEYGDSKISSSQIISQIKQSDLATIKQTLGRNYSLKGVVIKGLEQGRKLGFPTANLSANSKYIIPSSGVYKTKVIYQNNEYQAVTNIGIRPTFNGTTLAIETHILNFDKNIYGETIEVIFITKIRDEIKFENIDQLKKQIKADIISIQK